MNNYLRNFLKVLGYFFVIIGSLHLLRLVFKWPVSVDGVIIPFWVSVVAFALTALFAYLAFKHAKRV